MSELTPQDWSTQRLMHGLLQAQAERENGIGLERLERALAGLSAGPVGQRSRLRRASLVALAACVPFILLVGLFTLRGESAYALVRASARAERASDTARFLISAFALNTADEESLILRGSMDIGADQLARFQATPADGGLQLSLGRTQRGNWMQVGAAPVVWFQQGAPGNEALDHPTTMLGSVDTFLDLLADTYDLELLDSQVESEGLQVLATRTLAHGVHPRHVKLWIAESSRRVQRIELHWQGLAPLSLGDFHSGLAQSMDPATFLLVLPRLLADSDKRLTRMVLVQAAPLELSSGDFLPGQH